MAKTWLGEMIVEELRRAVRRPALSAKAKAESPIVAVLRQSNLLGPLPISVPPGPLPEGGLARAAPNNPGRVREYFDDRIMRDICWAGFDRGFLAGSGRRLWTSA
jgi:hypothetical protein